MGNCFNLKYRDIVAFSVESPTNNHSAPWYVPNTVTQRDLQVTTVKQEARKCSVNYRKRLDVHPNCLANTLFLKQPVARRLKRL
jgi:hypothetical protein